MVGTDEYNWQHVDLFVDRQINSDDAHVWPFANSFPVDVQFLVLDRRHDVPMHRPDHFEVVFFESGETGYEVEQRSCTLRQNDIIVVGDRIRHRCLPFDGSRREPRIVVLSFHPTVFHTGGAGGDDLQYLMPFSLQDPSFPNVVPAGAGLWREAVEQIQRIRKELPGASERSRLAIRTYLRMLLLALVNYYSEIGEGRTALSRRQTDLNRLAPVFEHLNRHCDEPIRIDDAARLCAMSACCFMQLFKEVTGESFVPYVNRFRVTRAQALLTSSAKTIAEISHESGFCDQSYFGVIFRRITGVTPRAYRRLHSATQQ